MTWFGSPKSPPPPPKFGIGFERRGRFRQVFPEGALFLGVRFIKGGWDYLTPMNPRSPPPPSLKNPINIASYIVTRGIRHNPP